MPECINFNNESLTNNNEQFDNKHTLLNNNLINEENDYLGFKKKIMSDNTIDNHMKSILLQNRKEYLDNLRKKINLQEEAILTPELKYFMVEFEKKCIISKKYQNHKNFLIKKIKNYCNGDIKMIYMEFEMCWDIYKLINGKIFDIEKKNKLFEIFKPSDNKEYENYVKIIEISKKEYDKKQKKDHDKKKLEYESLKKKEEDEKNKKIIEEKNKNLIIDREKIISILEYYLNKLAPYDNDAKQLKIELNKSGIIKKFLDLETEHIILDKSLHSRLNCFFDSVRISHNEKNNILTKIKLLDQ